MTHVVAPVGTFDFMIRSYFCHPAATLDTSHQAAVQSGLREPLQAIGTLEKLGFADHYPMFNWL